VVVVCPFCPFFATFTKIPQVPSFQAQTPVNWAEDERKEIHITEVVDEHTVRVEEDMSDWVSELFVWGQKFITSTTSTRTIYSL